MSHDLNSRVERIAENVAKLAVTVDDLHGVMRTLAEAQARTEAGLHRLEAALESRDKFNFFVQFAREWIRDQPPPGA